MATPKTEAVTGDTQQKEKPPSTRGRKPGPKKKNIYQKILDIKKTTDEFVIHNILRYAQTEFLNGNIIAIPVAHFPVGKGYLFINAEAPEEKIEIPCSIDVTVEPIRALTFCLKTLFQIEDAETEEDNLKREGEKKPPCESKGKTETPDKLDATQENPKEEVSAEDPEDPVITPESPWSIPDKEIRVESVQGSGDRIVVEMTHIPTGVIASSQPVGGLNACKYSARSTLEKAVALHLKFVAESKKNKKTKPLKKAKLSILKESEIKVDMYSASGDERMPKNAVKITHIPTGLQASSEDKKTMNKNKIAAHKELESLVSNYKAPPEKTQEETPENPPKTDIKPKEEAPEEKVTQESSEAREPEDTQGSAPPPEEEEAKEEQLTPTNKLEIEIPDNPEPMKTQMLHREIREQEGLSPDKLYMESLEWVDTTCEALLSPESWKMGYLVIKSDNRWKKADGPSRRSIEDYFFTLYNDFAGVFNEAIKGK